MKSLYLGLRLPKDCPSSYFHYPIIKIIPLPTPFYINLTSFTHIIFTSQTAVSLFFSFFNEAHFIKNKTFLAVGPKTAAEIQKNLPVFPLFPDKKENQTAEGILSLIDSLNLPTSSYVLWPKGKKAREVLTFGLSRFKLQEKVLYDTIPFLPSFFPPWEKINEIIFTSPSTVDAFFSFFSFIPPHCKLTSIGQITQNRLNSSYLS